ncbi:hypothetical protein ACWDCC_35795 [Streptomyces sp. NPDC001102]
MGAALGVVMARGDLAGDLSDRLRVAHETINLLGWVGLTVAGTLITLWPTMLRTRVADGAERAGRTALPVLLTGLGAAVAGTLLGPPALAAPGMVGYAAGLVVAGRPWLRGKRVRIWVLAAVPNESSAFQVVGGQFDTVFREGVYDLARGRSQSGGAQVLDLAPASGGFVELSFPQAGDYPFVTHIMSDAERGAHGVFRVR